jgi:uncharacterized protein (TIGR01777 family)
MMKHILLSGASGLVGGTLATSLKRAGHDVRRLVRRQPAAPGEYRWDPYRDDIDEIALKGLDAVIHLSGAGIGDRRWTAERKRQIYDSRIVTTRMLADHLARLDTPPAVMISQSAVGIYGDRGDERLTETSTLGPTDDFLASLTMDWEEAAGPAREAGIRVVHPRTGLVIDHDAQLMARLVPLFRAGLGGPIGDGRQWWSWISLHDVISALEHLVESDLSGAVNLVSPQPVRQREFADILASVLRRPALLPVPRFGMRLVLGAEKADAIGFSSTRVEPVRLSEDGFRFADPELEPALRRMLT